MQSIFGTDGIRGRFNKEITYSLAYKVGYALGSSIKNKSPIIIVFKFVLKIGSRLSDCTFRVLLAKIILNKLIN